MSFGPKTQATIDRIAGLDLANPVIDRERVECGIHQHLVALGLPDRPVRWFDDARAALAALDARDARDALAALDARAARDARDARAARAALDARDALDALDARDALDALAARAARDARDARDARAALDALAARGSWRFDAYYSLREAVYWIAASESSSHRIPEVEKAAGVWLPFVDAYEAGLWIYWLFERSVCCWSRPAAMISGERLHCENGPAIWWPSGEKYFYLNGIEVPEALVMTSAGELSTQARKWIAERNVEVRREYLRKVGIESALSALKPRLLDRSPWGPNPNTEYELLSINLGPDVGEKRVLKMRNPTIGCWHVEGVEDDVETVEQAHNWRASGNKHEPWKPALLT